MDISVVIVTHNEENNIRTCLESVLKQAPTGGNWEIIVVDGKSQDNTVKFVHEMQKTSDRIRLITNEKQQIALFSATNFV